jgi:diacylglycerol kinase (ATP)
MPSNKQSNELRRLVAAFHYSIAGLRVAWTQPAFRVETLSLPVMVPAAFVIAHSGAELALLLGSLWLVMIVELLNTGIEKAIDRVSPEWHELSKQAKDLGSAAVLFSLGLAATVWLSVLLF